MTTALILAAVLAYLVVHGWQYGSRRRRGLSVWASIPGPFGTRISRRL